MFLSMHVFAGNIEICSQLLESNYIYSSEVQIQSQKLVAINSRLLPLEREQITAFYNINHPVSSSLEGTIINTNESFVITNIIHILSEKKYIRVQSWHGDTESSAIFEANSASPLAFTGNGDCYQFIEI